LRTAFYLPPAFSGCKGLIGVNAMIYIQIQDVLKAKRKAWGRKITLNEVSLSTGISRTTLFRIMKNEGYSTVTDHIDKLCAFFDCEVFELVKYVPDRLASQYSLAA
jgi:putative transcriptional regulator